MLLDKNISYYLCDGIKFHSKINALIYSQTMKKPINWIFGLDEVYSKYAWDIEPPESLDELYDRRARELREKYDYILLAYSGGADSHNMLMSFYRQGLHVDEVVTTHVDKAGNKLSDYSGNNFSPENLHAEYVLTTIPKLQWIHDNMPATKITSLDMSDTVLNAFDGVDDESWVLKKYNLLNIYNHRFDYFSKKECLQTFDAGKKIGYVLGIDKPKTFIKNNLFYISFSDAALASSSNVEFNHDYTNFHTECFYWSDTTAPMICKQAYVIKSYLEKNRGRRYFWDKGYTVEIGRTLHEQWLGNIIYTTWDSSFQVTKSLSAWNNEFDYWWFESIKNTRAETIYNLGIDYVRTAASNYIRPNKKNKSDGFISFTKQYLIKKMNDNVE